MMAAGGWGGWAPAPQYSDRLSSLALFLLDWFMELRYDTELFFLSGSNMAPLYIGFAVVRLLRS